MSREIQYLDAKRNKTKFIRDIKGIECRIAIRYAKLKYRTNETD